ncbi:transcriptional regulator [Azorhizobium oxalatiphilum]|uniref:Transcriptional regulator n=1 Tax=Azorhizobium oxalatiphilum TaxID=980631 RepID=A0A917CGY7_9HYPH|nr:transcriptional regulator [Azorhizobium oxalatiphilum]
MRPTEVAANGKGQGLVDQVAETPKLNVEPLGASSSLRALAYDALKRAITEMDIYGSSTDFRLDERQLSEDLGVSRTPIREAMTVLEQEGFVRSVPRRGIFVVRKTKRQLVEMITVWAALESMAARLAAAHASTADLNGLRRLFNEFEVEPPGAHVHEYSQANIAFHQAIIRMGGSALIVDMTENLFLHMRAIRTVSIRQENRSERSMQEHMAIIDALEARDPDLAERLVREHTMALAALVEKHGQFPE